jgi:hypothetical protein
MTTTASIFTSLFESNGLGERDMWAPKLPVFPHNFLLTADAEKLADAVGADQCRTTVNEPLDALSPSRFIPHPDIPQSIGERITTEWNKNDEGIVGLAAAIDAAVAERTSAICNIIRHYAGLCDGLRIIEEIEKLK